MSDFFRNRNLDNPALKHHMSQSGRPNSVSFKPTGYGDVIWCPIINEPGFLVYDKAGTPQCSECDMTAFEDGRFAEHHQYIATVRKPSVSAG